MRRGFSTVLVLACGLMFLSGQISDMGSGFSRGNTSLSSDNTFTGTQTFTVNPPTRATIKFDATAYNNGVDGTWPLQFHDYIVSRDPGGLDPGNPRAAFNHMGSIWTATTILASLDTVGDIDDGDFHPRFPFETSTASVGVISYAGAYIGMVASYSDVNGPAFQCTVGGAESDGSLIAGGTRTVGVDNAVLTFMVGKDGTIYMGSDSTPNISSGVIQNPEEQDGLAPMLWRAGSYNPATGGKLTVVGEQSIDKLGQVAGGAVANVGTAGATTYTYVIVPETTSGIKGVASSNITTATGHATLDGTNFNRLTWTRKTGVATYYVYRTVGGGSTGIIGSVAGNAAAMQFDDTGLAGGSETANSIDPTGDLTVQGEIAGAPINWTAARASITADDTVLNYEGVQGQITAPLLGFRTRGSGSILGITLSANRVTCGAAAAGTPRVQIYNGTSAISGCVAAFGSALASGSGVHNGTATFTRGTYTWSGAQTLNAVLDFNGASVDGGSIVIIVQVYMCYD